MKPTLVLAPSEYSKIYSEINTCYSKYKDFKIAMHTSYGIDNKAYVYYFENFGYNDYNIFARIEI